MTLITFSKIKTKPVTAKKDDGNDDYCTKIENCKNYNQQYALIEPDLYFKDTMTSSLVFKKESNNHEVCYEYWVKINSKKTFFSITVSQKDRQLDSIRDESGYSVPLNSFKINDSNELEIVYYDRCRPF